jgi:hypothetical protein
MKLIPLVALVALLILVALWRRSLRGWEPDPYAEPWGDL